MIKKLEWVRKKGYEDLIYHTCKISESVFYKITENTNRGVLMMMVNGTKIEKNFGYDKSLTSAKQKFQNYHQKKETLL